MNKSKLTPRMTMIARLLKVGKTHRQIAYELGISEHTVKTHIGRMYLRLGAVNAADLVRIMYENEIE